MTFEEFQLMDVAVGVDLGTDDKTVAFIARREVREEREVVDQLKELHGHIRTARAEMTEAVRSKNYGWARTAEQHLHDLLGRALGVPKEYLYLPSPSVKHQDPIEGPSDEESLKPKRVVEV